VPCDLVLAAVGYFGVPLEGVPFDQRRGVIPNREGRVLESPTGDPVPGLYVVGWAKRGPTGLIGTNSPDSRATIQALVEDALENRIPVVSASEVTAGLLEARGIDYATFEDWQRLDAFELAEGRKRGKVRHKLHDVDEMMERIRALRDAAGGAERA
jgi:ferredoxin--NADP+ reductase